MSLGAQVDVSGVEANFLLLRRLADNAADARGFLERAADVLMEASRQRWRTNGPGWRMLAESTRRHKAAASDPRTRANANRPLRATGALERALTVWGSAGQKLEYTPDSLAFGIYVGAASGRDVWYGAIAQKGAGSQPRRTILAKPSPGTRRKLIDELRRHILGAGR